MQIFVNIIINEQNVKVQKGLTIIQACEIIGIQIPRFCYHEQLSIAGNCRMCLVEVKNSVKPVAACAITVESNMEIFTNTFLVKKAREGVMEFLLINHPLDCPICDQGGECDLQDQAMIFGNDRGRFYEFKRAVSELELGPFIKTVMTRCIHCTRCIRFLSELGGSMQLGTLGRGNKTEIGSYIFNNISSEVSGNIIDLCPVGALTSKPYAFTARAWELIRIETIDTLDGFGTNISYGLYGNKLMRVLPVIHIGINEEWLSDKTRFSYDGFTVQRISVPLWKKNTFFNKKTWQSTFLELICNIEKNLTLVINHDLSLETLYILRDLKNKFQKINIVIKDSLIRRNIDYKTAYIFNSTYVKIKQGDFFCIIGCNLKVEAPLLLIRLRKEKRLRDFNLVVFGILERYALSEHCLGINMSTLLKFREGKHYGSSLLKKAKFPIIILGMNILSSINCNIIIKMFLTIKTCNNIEWCGVNVLESGAGIVGGYDIGIMNNFVTRKTRNIINLNNMQYNLKENGVLGIYLGTHGDTSRLKKYNGILPITTNIEKEGLFMNNEGKVQVAKIVQNSFKKSRSDWQILSGLFEILFNISYINLKLEVFRNKFNKVFLGQLNINGYFTFSKEISYKNKLYNIPLLPYMINIYEGNSIIKNSRIFANSKKYLIKNTYN